MKKIIVNFTNGTFVTTGSSIEPIKESDTLFISASYKYPRDFQHHFITNVCGETKADVEVVYTDSAAEKIFNLIEFNRVDS